MYNLVSKFDLDPKWYVYEKKGSMTQKKLIFYIFQMFFNCGSSCGSNGYYSKNQWVENIFYWLIVWSFLLYTYNTVEKIFSGQKKSNISWKYKSKRVKFHYDFVKIGVKFFFSSFDILLSGPYSISSFSISSSSFFDKFHKSLPSWFHINHTHQTGVNHFRQLK